MRTQTAAHTAVLTSPYRAEHFKVEVKDSGGTFRDLSTYPGYDAVLSASWKEDIDSPHMTAAVRLIREHHDFSIAPLMQSSAANTGFVPGGAYAALLALNREIKISVAIIGADCTPVSGDWMLVFHGRIDTIDSGSEEVTLDCRDLGGKLANCFIETERAYAAAKVAGVPVTLEVWTAGRTWVLGQYVTPTEANKNIPKDASGTPRFYVVTTAGAGGNSEPEWPGSGTVADNAAVFTYQGVQDPVTGGPIENVIQLLMNDNTTSPPTLYTPVSPSWALTGFKQDREPVLDAIRRMAAMCGFDVRYKWRSGTSAFELTLFEPARTKTVPDHTLTADDYENISTFKQDLSGIRNVWRVFYHDISNPDAQGLGIRKYVDRSDATSITAYGRLFAEISEGNSSMIDTSTEAQRMADAALADTKDPLAEQRVEMALAFPWVELGDLYRLTSPRHFTGNFDVAVAGYEHDASEGRIRTRITLRGKPSLGWDRWHSISALSNPEDTHQTHVYEASGGVNIIVTQTIGGIGVFVDTPSFTMPGSYPPMYEFHVGTTSNFTASAATLKAASYSRFVQISDLIPGATYYVRVTPRILNAGRLASGEPSQSIETSAGRAAAGHLASEVEWGRFPLNGGFENQTDPAAPPDHWEVTDGVWGTDFALITDGTGRSGLNYLEYVDSGISTITREIRSGLFPATEGERYAVSFYRKNRASIATAGGTFGIYFFESDGTTQIGSISGLSNWAGTDSVGDWVKETSDSIEAAPADARFARVAFTQSGVGTLDAVIDDVRVERSPIGDVGLASLGADVDFALPLNGGFESNANVSNIPPDHWYMYTGTFGTDVTRSTGSGARGGNTYLVSPSSTGTWDIFSERMEVTEGDVITMSLWAKGVSGTGYLYLDMYFEDAAGGYVSDPNVSLPASTTAWTHLKLVETVPANARYLWCYIGTTGASAKAFDLDSVRITMGNRQQTGVAIPYTNSGGTTWTDFGGAHLAGTSFKDSMGVVHLEGACKRTAGAGAIIGTLAAAHRPSATIEFPVSTSAGTYGAVSITSAGVITLLAGNAACVALSGIIFRTT